MEIVYRKLSELKPNPKNPRKATKEAIEKLARSISENPKFFEARPILLSDRTGELVIIGGEQRSKAAAILKMETVPTILIPGLDEAGEDEVLFLDNTHSGVWDEQKLTKWDKGQLKQWNVDGVKWPKEPIQAKEDNFDPDKKVKSRVKRGDIWQLGRHRLMCGDSTNSKDIEKLMGGAEVDLFLTDPPYGVDYVGKTEDELKIQNDSFSSDDEFFNFLRNAFIVADKVMKPGGSYYIFYADSTVTIFRKACEVIGAVRQCLIWVKNCMVMGRRDYQWRHEPCLYGWKDGAAHKWYAGREETTCLFFDRPVRNLEHPTMKPIKLFAYLISNSTKEADKVLDLFGGSGTTLIACEELRRDCYMMEIDPHYCDVIIDRWEQFAGKKAKKLTTA